MNRDEATLMDVARAADLVVRFSGEVDQATFESDLLVQSAVLHQLLVMGEAVKRLSASFREQHNHIPWHLVARNRDRLIHGYDTIDLGLVWDTAVRDVPALRAQLDPLLPPQVAD